MNTANDFTCSMFHESLRAFIDDELPINIRSSFLAHAETCFQCGRELSSLQGLTQRLRKLTPVTVSPEFDFSMKLRLRREQQFMKRPLYQLTHAVRDNFRRLLLVPAAAAVLMVSVIYFSADPAVDAPHSLPPSVVQELESMDGVELTADTGEHEIDQVRYVLETVTQHDIERGLIGTGETGTASLPSFNLISF